MGTKTWLPAGDLLSIQCMRKSSFYGFSYCTLLCYRNNVYIIGLSFLITPRASDGYNSFDIVCLCLCVCVCVTSLTAKQTDLGWLLEPMMTSSVEIPSK